MTRLPIEALVATIFAAPLIASATIALPAWFGRSLSERATHRITAAAFFASTLAGLLTLLVMALTANHEVRVPLGTWFEIGSYAFRWELIADRLSVPFAIFSSALVGLIGAFSRRYVHREPGFTRFYILLALFGTSVVMVVLAGGLDMIFFGWEIVGLCSVLLIAFFHERRMPVLNGLRTFVTYRLCDVGLVGAIVWLHHHTGTTALSSWEGGPWAGFTGLERVGDAAVLGLLLLWGSMGKAAQVPLGGWLPRAMEGPTPSSAIFYGALSIHLGPYLLLRAAPLLEAAPAAAWAVVAVGAITAVHGTFVGRAQSDVKSLLAYASMTQVGLIYVEIGLGLRFFALAHIVGHATVRALQILRSPSLLHDHHHLEQAVGDTLPRTGGHLERLVPRALQPWLYRHALERGYFDALLQDYVVAPVVAVLLWMDRAERRWVDWLELGKSEGP